MSQTSVTLELQHLHGDGAAVAVVTPFRSAEPPADTAPRQEDEPQLPLLRLSTIAATITGILVASSMTTGLITIALPTMAKDLDIPEHLLLWPASIYGLTSGCSLLMAGSIADFIGSRPVYLVGCLLLSLSMLASGLARTSTQLIVFRGFQGVAASCCLPTAVSLMSESFPGGRRRNVAFAVMGAGQPLGFSLGLFLSGFFVDSVGWRYSWYLCAAVAAAVFVVAAWALPPRKASREAAFSWDALFRQLDFVGAGIASACLGILSYVLAVVSEGPAEIRKGENIALLCVAAALLPSFVFWMDLRTRRGVAALIPNAIWRKAAFSNVCAMVFVTWAVLNVVDFYASLLLQDVQSLSALHTSIRFLPNALSGILLSIATGALLHRISAYPLVLAASLASTLSPLLFALDRPEWSYWFAQFWAMLLSAVAVDVLFVFGGAVGLALMAVVSAKVTDASAYAVKTDPLALLEGYRAAFWACCAAMGVSVGIGAFGLRDVGRFGVKEE